MTDRGFPKPFDGRRFYNPDAPQARGFLDALRWKLSSRPEPSPEFISDVEQSTPPRCLESKRSLQYTADRRGRGVSMAFDLALRSQGLRCTPLPFVPKQEQWSTLPWKQHPLHPYVP